MTQPKRYTTSAYRDLLARWVWLLPGLSLVVALVGLAAETRLWTDAKFVLPENDLVSPVLVLRPSWLGAFRIQARVELPYQRWAALQISLEDERGQTLIEAGRELWAERGIWREGSESGTWEEQDVEFELDAALPSTTRARVRVELVELTDTAARPILDEAVAVRASLQGRASDGRWLWFGFLATLIMAIVTTFSVSVAGKVVVLESAEDSEVEARGVVGGPRRLTALRVVAAGDETTPSTVRVRVAILDEDRRELFDEEIPVDAQISKDEDGEITGAKIVLRLFLELPRRANYVFWAEVIPDGPIDSIKLLVRDDCHTLGETEVIRLEGERAA